MKNNRFIFTNIALLLSLFISADIRTLRPGLEIEETIDSYLISFEAPEYIIATDTLSAYSFDYLFSRIQFYNDYFDHVDYEGYPTLPYLALDLILPPKVCNYNVNIDILQTDTVVLPYDYTPAQMARQSEGICLAPNYIACSDSCWWDRGDYTITTYGLGKYKGLNFSYNPVMYDFYSKTVVIVTKAFITISFSYHYNSLFSSSDYLSNYIDNLSMYSDQTALTYFDNFINDDRLFTERTFFNDNYLIITTDQFSTNRDLLDFANHKASLGYMIDIVPLSTTGSTPQSIRSYIRNRLYGAENSLNFVLLVGDIDMIPYSRGTEEDHTNPPTDIIYGCLKEVNIDAQWYDLTPDVYVGRWPVKDTTQLRNVIYKTIRHEEIAGQYSPNRIALFSGSGFGQNYVYKDCRYIYDKVVHGFCDESHERYFSGDIFDGRGLESSGYEIFKAEMEGMHDDWPWMIFYTGHGSNDLLGSPFHDVNTTAIKEYIRSDNAPYPAFGFGFACLLGNMYSDDNFARDWVTSENGGVSFLGATTESFFEPDRYMSRKIFHQLEHKPVMTVGEFVANGISKYYNAFRVVWRRRQAMRYVFYGDPSIYLYGLDFQNYTPLRSPQMRDIENTNTNHVLNNIISDHHLSLNEISSIQLYSISGHMIYNGNMDDLNLQNYNNGIIFVVIRTQDKLISNKILIK